MRQIVLDTETTGRDLAEGHKVIEIGCLELINRRITKVFFHQYINPQRESEAGALAVHGITQEMLADKPLFADIIEPFLAFIKGAQLIIHNAPFDVGFLNHEFQCAGKKYGQLLDHCTVIDTLPLARQLHPGQRNSLDALCKRYAVDNSHREFHGALLDAELLAKVYLAMTGGQTSLFSDELMQPELQVSVSQQNDLPVNTAPLRVIYANDDEIKAHQDYMAMLSKKAKNGCLWETTS